MEVGLWERLPEAGQSDAPGRLRWARGGTGRARWDRMMVLRAEAVSGAVGSNLPASRAPEPQLWGSAQRIDKAKPPVQSVCVFCNRHKGPNVAGVDPTTKRIVPLFHPRRHKWSRHFRWDGAVLVGRTPTGRATVIALKINLDHRIDLRQGLIDEGVFPPA